MLGFGAKGLRYWGLGYYLGKGSRVLGFRASKLAGLLIRTQVRV